MNTSNIFLPAQVGQELMCSLVVYQKVNRPAPEIETTDRAFIDPSILKMKDEESSTLYVGNDIEFIKRRFPNGVAYLSVKEILQSDDGSYRVSLVVPETKILFLGTIRKEEQPSDVNNPDRWIGIFRNEKYDLTAMWDSYHDMALVHRDQVITGKVLPIHGFDPHTTFKIAHLRISRINKSMPTRPFVFIEASGMGTTWTGMAQQGSKEIVFISHDRMSKVIWEANDSVPYLIVRDGNAFSLYGGSPYDVIHSYRDEEGRRNHDVGLPKIGNRFEAQLFEDGKLDETWYKCTMTFSFGRKYIVPDAIKIEAVKNGLDVDVPVVNEDNIANWRYLA